MHLREKSKRKKKNRSSKVKAVVFSSPLPFPLKLQKLIWKSGSSPSLCMWRLEFNMWLLSLPYSGSFHLSEPGIHLFVLYLLSIYCVSDIRE